ncbi:hypothetical protein C3941_09180 [Kaistia algarum]|uniref:TIR domain-containing protein n=1 Tax=Kaistia algarum TaxID=2083279 RepID=UPI000CE7C190|nr:toll/interleukin-1 receptor domain-containing protein [Kaistia algarum]MCX5512231.1 toll/interleukin-1 receptor domain-containing protein [Kaistia algarum]PPE80326.1 hypothetical protein C3941_09180 [Kaistia algarum]
MRPPSVFISYSHADEWLKSELITHLSALKRNGAIEVWHDRLIPPGNLLADDIDEKVNTSDIFLFLVSPAFIESDYCFHKEYETAKTRQELGEAVIVPIIVREGDWDVGGLRNYNALPPDAIAVAKDALDRTQPQQRDGKWAAVVDGLKLVLQALKKKRTPPSLPQDYIDRLFIVDFIRHPSLAEFDERRIFVDPDIYYENRKEQLTSFEAFAESIKLQPVSIITGGDRSGKSLLAKKLQFFLDSCEEPTAYIRGRSIKNADIVGIAERAIRSQYGDTPYDRRSFSIVIDDFDECTLADNIKERMIALLSETYGRIILFSYTSAPSVLFAADGLPDPHVFNINQLARDKVYRIVFKWKEIGLSSGLVPDDRHFLETLEKINLIFDQSEIECSAYSTVTFLELLDNAVGGDIAISSFASCYEALITARLQTARVDWHNFDEAKNFLAYLAFQSFATVESRDVSSEMFESALDLFEQRYLSSRAALSRMALGSFLTKDEDGGYFFREEYLWYFLCARHVAKDLSVDDRTSYERFVKTCSMNIFQKKYANIAIFIAYFSSDNLVLSCLTDTLKGLFSKAEAWELSDGIREIMLGIGPGTGLYITASNDVDRNRLAILREKINDIVGDAMKVVARYTLPFLHSSIADSEFVEAISSDEIDGDSYMRSVNALLRTHSVLGQILSTRAGTFGADVLLDCITNMVHASGRYASLNHAIATVLMHEDDETTHAEVQRAISGDLSPQEKLKKVQRIFAFWSVYLSQAGLARYLSNAHAIRALETLRDRNEIESRLHRDLPFNYTSVLIIARLYHTGKISRTDIEDCLERYGPHSAVLQLLKVAIHIYTYYMPLETEEKQWLAAKLSLPVQKLEAQRFRRSAIGRDIIRKTRILPNPKRD